MAVAAIRRENESSEKLIGRWNKKAQAARVVNEVKNRRYFDRKKRSPNELRIKRTALKREQFRADKKVQQFY